jgi:hypothetical protein
MGRPEAFPANNHAFSKAFPAAFFEWNAVGAPASSRACGDRFRQIIKTRP